MVLTVPPLVVKFVILALNVTVARYRIGRG